MPVRRRRPTALAAAVATAAALGTTALAALGGATAASAAGSPLSDYELTWGIKQSYRTYVGMFGSFTASEGAGQAAGNGAFTFTGGTGTYDHTTNAVDLGFKGKLVSASAAHRFEVTLTDVRFDSGAGEITADVTTVDTSGATPTKKGDDVPLAKVAVTRAMTDMATTLTTEAGEYLGSASYAGAAGDPLTVVRKTPEPSTEPTTGPTAQPTTGPSTEPSTGPTGPTGPEPTGTDSTGPGPTGPQTTPATQGPGPATSTSASPSAPASTAPTRGEIADGTLGWGVKESFRAYVVGNIAKGRVTVSGGAGQAAGNGAFTFKDATGTYDTDADRLTAAFKGAVNFKGHESGGTYGLDLTLSNLKATLDGGTGKLTADVDSLGTRTEGVVLADLEAKSGDLKADKNVITVDGIAATVTDAGAKVFGNYPAGTALDPVGLSVALSDDAQLPDGGGSGGPGGTGGGSGTAGGSTGGGTGTAGGTGSTVGGTGTTTGGSIGGGSLASTGSDIPGPALGAAAGAAVAVGAGAVYATRRRRTQARSAG
ncbi:MULTISPECIES: HtaA domain-containing protein [Streptomyces]|nr:MULTISPECIES: HtaA domain-containing protein [Streptomyces]MCW8119699.1 HtaA domain-containing protein [Streptomyces anthocyanicus]REH20550.1 Htaa protein [Streptomyces sp. 2221.1]WSB63628.1 HtaA domain-containing protein [Streptomyces anthocyanicus]SDT28255.1 Htaa protein [Streptomyces sp. 2114.2]